MSSRKRTATSAPIRESSTLAVRTSPDVLSSNLMYSSTKLRCLPECQGHAQLPVFPSYYFWKFNGEQRNIIVEVRSSAPFLHFLIQALEHLIQRFMRCPVQIIQEALLSEEFAIGAHAFRDSVGVNQQTVAWRYGNVDTIEVHFRPQAHRHSSASQNPRSCSRPDKN